jgi:hypothetical protein
MMTMGGHRSTLKLAMSNLLVIAIRRAAHAVTSVKPENAAVVSTCWNFSERLG